MGNINAKEEFLRIVAYYKVIAAVISFGDYSWEEEGSTRFILKPLYTKKDYEKFLKFLDHEYNNGYGGQNLFGTIYCEDGVWIDRGEYDGSEWWKIHKYPDLRETFDESDVIKYERSKKLKNLNGYQ